jgi:hypothetical protein
MRYVGQFIFNHLSSEGHVACFRFGAIMNKTAICMILKLKLILTSRPKLC